MCARPKKTEFKPQPEAYKGAVEKPHVLEKGLIIFLARPKTNVKMPVDTSQVRELFILMVPGGSDLEQLRNPDMKKRLLRLQRKELPEPGQERATITVEMVTNWIEEIDKQLGRINYETPQHKKHFLPPAAAIGEGVYAVLELPQYTALAYKLIRPEPVSAVHEEKFNVHQEGFYVIATRSEQGGWQHLHDPALLDVEHSKVLLDGITVDPADLGSASEQLRQTYETSKSLVANSALVYPWEVAQPTLPGSLAGSR